MADGRQVKLANRTDGGRCSAASRTYGSCPTLGSISCIGWHSEDPELKSDVIIRLAQTMWVKALWAVLACWCCLSGSLQVTVCNNIQVQCLSCPFDGTNTASMHVLVPVTSCAHVHSEGWNASGAVSAALSCPVGASLVAWVIIGTEIERMQMRCDGRHLPGWCSPVHTSSDYSTINHPCVDASAFIIRAPIRHLNLCSLSDKPWIIK